MNILLLDNYDSFTYNLLHIIRKLGYKHIDVIRNDKIALADVALYDKIMLSPGPGVPAEAGIMMDLIRTYAPTKSIFGVCLGHQAIGEAFGGVLYNIQQVIHGKAIQTTLIDQDYIFQGIPTTFKSGRYHSWAIKREPLPVTLKVTAVDEKGIVMALKHTQYDIHGVQFHPESIMTEFGELMVKNWLEHT